MNRPIYVVDIIGDIVSEVSTALLAQLQAVDPNITRVNYLYGPPKEINNTLTDWTKLAGKDKDKYPCVMLLQSFPETFTSSTIQTVNLHILIARRNSNEKLKSADRYENNFKPVLYPVYYEFMRQLGDYPAIVSNGYLDHVKTDWPFWGGTEDQAKNPFNDKIDIIELKINNLTIDLLLCQTL